jgi:hypothetical protein
MYVLRGLRIYLHINRKYTVIKLFLDIVSAIFDSTLTANQGVDVMITIFCNFCQFLADKIGGFLENQCCDNFLQKLAVVGAEKNVHILPIFLDENIFKIIISVRPLVFRN